MIGEAVQVDDFIVVEVPVPEAQLLDVAYRWRVTNARTLNIRYVAALRDGQGELKLACECELESCPHIQAVMTVVSQETPR